MVDMELVLGSKVGGLRVTGTGRAVAVSMIVVVAVTQSATSVPADSMDWVHSEMAVVVEEEIS